MSLRISTVLVLLCVVAGCGATSKQLLRRASADMKCPVDGLSVTPVDGRTRRVSGCGQDATYVSLCNSTYGGCTWVLNSEVADERAPTQHVILVGELPKETPEDASIEVGKAKDGNKTIKLALKGDEWRMFVHAAPRTDAQVAILIWRLRRNAPSAAACEIKLVANGERVELGAETKVAEREQTLDYRTALPYASLMQIASSARVAGRLCQTEIALTDTQLEKLRELVMLIREEQAWDEKPAPEDGEKAAGTEL